MLMQIGDGNLQLNKKDNILGVVKFLLLRVAIAGVLNLTDYNPQKKCIMRLVENV
jgi:hypothetical protein